MKINYKATKQARNVYLIMIFSSILSFSVLFSQERQTQTLRTDRLEYTGTYRGSTKYDFDIQDHVLVNGDQELFTSGFTSAFHLAGINPEGSLSVSANYYPTGNNTDFHLGMLSNNGNVEIISGSETFFDKIWTVYDYQIYTLLDLKENGGITINDIPEDIRTWPARGNPFIDQAYVTEDVAPFHDEDLDGMYNPLMGDYPVVSSKDGDFFLLSLFFLLIMI